MNGSSSTARTRTPGSVDDFGPSVAGVAGRAIVHISTKVLRCGYFLFNALVGTRQINAECAAVSRRRRDVYRAAKLGNDLVHYGQSKSCSHAATLGREERFEQS